MSTPTKDPLRPHEYDGIQEYDNLMPNWWLVTFWAGVAFGFGYWIWTQTLQMTGEPGPELEAQMAENSKIAARNSTVLTDESLWVMSRDAQVAAAGKTTYLTTCAACHLPDLAGQVGPNLKDQNWIHGGKPMEMIKTVVDGVPAKGMPSWGPILGKQKIAESIAFILSYHKEGEPINIVPSPTPGQPPPAPAP